ncbi:C1 family peptidase [Ferrovum sp.]|uniref:C1 family peptidase n=1 Tax=Ferrovum sp. TaxID=2609467 RepID=UPI00260291E7|nr:C1 family peptidase [Ferrovum sp.]
MANLNTVGDLRKALAAEGIRWTINPRFADTEALIQPHLGALTEQIPRAASLSRVNVAEAVAKQVPANTLLLKHLIAIGVLQASAEEQRQPVTPHPAIPHLTIPHLIIQPKDIPSGGPAPGGGSSQSVDWRNRWGTPWISEIRDQDPCEHCWIYGSTALVEAMVRIEHCVWCDRSEGDYIEANKIPCGQCGNPIDVLNWYASNGVCDQSCAAWVDTDPGNRTSSYWNPSPLTGCGSGSMLPPPLYNPPSNRNGKTVKIPAYTALGNTSDQKDWIDQIGPLVVTMDIYSDFYYWAGPSPYIQSKSATCEGSHVMLAVGYDDGQQCWIVKNSWGTNFGDQGYILIGYGQCNIDYYGKIGLQGTNPDPWTKRRLHSGGMVESGNGATHRNFELLALINGTQVAHWWRDNTASGFPWARAEVFANDVGGRPTLTATTYNRNFETIYITNNNRLHHWYFDQSTGKWQDGGIFGPTDALTASTPGFIESDYGPGNFEAVVATQSGQLNHWWRDTSFQWHDGGRFASNILSSAATLIQSTYGNLELVALLTGGQMQHWWRDTSFQWHAGPVFGSNLISPPCMIQGQYGMGNENGTGNFELCVANSSGQVEHWWRDNAGGSQAWNKSVAFGHDVVFVIALIESSFGFNLEVIVHRRDGELQHYWRDGSGWHEGAVIGISL